ncbi:MAG: ABC transporter substrate-binding protein [Candidatus Saccharibacteria bacterium]|nr:ABC transporter substrate-binding protein [Candidatus Saccharibacteria bacterium]
MKNSVKKRGQKVIKRFSRFGKIAEQEGKEHLKTNFFGRLSHIKSIKLLILEWCLLISALILLAITQSIWLGNFYSSNSFVSGGSYTEGTVGKVNSLNPLFAVTDSEKALSRLLFATLSTVDYSGHIAPGLAKSIHTSEDGRTWTIKLRDNLKWSDGEPITNEDVLFTTSLIKNSAVSSIYDTNLSNVRVAEEDGKIVFTLPSIYADFDSALTFPILPKHILGNVDPKTLIENSFSTSPVTSGAFTYNATQTPSTGEKIFYLSANPSYYKGKPLLNSFAIHTYEDKGDLISDLNAGKITATAALSPAEKNLVTSSTIYEKQTSISSGVYAFLNTSKDPLKSKSLRQTIKRAINLDEIRAVTDGNPALDYPLTDAQIQLSKYPAPIGYNLDSAKSTVASDFSGITLSIATVNSGYLPVVAETFADSLRDAGIEVNVTAYTENQDFISSIVTKRNYDILIYEIELGADPDLFAYYHSSQASQSGLNLSNYKNSLIDDLILGARETTDDSLRLAKYESFLGYWVDDVPAIGLYRTNISYFYNKNVRTFSDDSHMVTALDRFVNVETWASEKTSKNRTP